MTNGKKKPEQLQLELMGSLIAKGAIEWFQREENRAKYEASKKKAS